MTALAQGGGEAALDRPAEVALAAATVLALVAVAGSLATLLRAGGRSADRSRLTPALVVLTGGAAVTFAAYLAFEFRCRGSACERGAGDGLLGFHHWWRAHDSWQWSGQLLLASVALVAAGAALWLGARDSRRKSAPLWAARLLYAGWVLLVFLPVLYELVTG
ncbi:MAG TPA: hypothetical protein VF545_00805 [Thermoleophilaceae bacterium]|jgi:cytochrome bd-type quinol oxidase subunit 2